MNNQTVCHGFRLDREEHVADINAHAKIFTHLGSGARLLHLGNDDPNNVFAVFFRTPPPDSTGVPHILEHAVLCGSRKFPTKEPFTALLKGSLKTFLNAFTFSDKTGYPVASQNERDFFHLMDVYLDAVLFPRIYDNPLIFRQEGWHHELYDADEELRYNGVVYNEMKGAFASPEGMLFNKIEQSLFPDTPYKHDSGGDPEVIPTLDYEGFLDFHRQYYHPSNGYFFLYGNGPLEDRLAFLDREYLIHFKKKDIRSSIPPQPPFPAIRDLEFPYPIAAGENAREKTYLTLNYVTGMVTDTETVFGLDLLNTILLETPASPLKKALIESGLGKDVFGVFSSEILQPVFSVVLKNSEREKKDSFVRLVQSVLRDLAQNGIDAKLKEAALNSKEFQLREADFKSTPKGLVYALQAMTSWIYDHDPIAPLRFEQPLASIRKKSAGSYFEDLIRDHLLDNRHGTCLLLYPVPGLAEEREKHIEAALAAHKSSLTPEGLKITIENTATLREYQATPDRPEDLATIPSLALTDIDPVPEKPPIAEKDGPVRTLFHPVPTNGIVYCNMFFDAGAVPQSHIPYLGLLADILGAVSTRHFHYTELSNELNIHLGGISFQAGAFGEFRNRDALHPKFSVSAKVLVPKFSELVHLAEEIMNRTDFSDEKRFREIIQETRSRLEMDLMYAGNRFAKRRIAAKLSPCGAYNEMIDGISYYKFIVELDNHFEDAWQGLAANLEMVGERLFSRANLLLSLTADEDSYPRLAVQFESLWEKLNKGERRKEALTFAPSLESEGFTIPEDIQYVAKGGDFTSSGKGYDHRMLTLQTVLNSDYLWNKVRVMGGAYGAGASFASDGTLFFSSYRDPHLKKTLQAFGSVGDYLRGFPYDQDELDKCIIGTIGRLDIPLTPSMKGERAASHHISCFTDADLEEERRAVLTTTKEDIAGFGDSVDKALANGIVCVIGGESKLRENSRLFDKITNLID